MWKAWNSMPYVQERFRTRNALVARSQQLVSDAVAAGLTVELVVPSRSWVQERKLQLMEAGFGGVGVGTFANWLAGLWDTFGDGSRVVTSVQRSLLARPLLAEMLEAVPSAGLLREFCSFLSVATSSNVLQAEGLNANEQRLMALVDRYRLLLQEHGLTELSMVQDVLVEARVPAGTVVVEEPAASARDERFLCELGSFATVHVLARDLAAGGQDDGPSSNVAELAELSRTLFTGHGGVQATGRVLAGEAHGAHVEGELLVELVRKLMQQGARVEDIAIVFSNAADSFPHVQSALARAGIPYACSFRVPARSTAFGSAFLDLVTLRMDSDERALYLAVSNLVSSVYSGVKGSDARALQMRWRMRATSVHEERIRDIRGGFAQGNADAALVRAKLEPLARLLDSPLPEAVHAMFDNAREARGLLDSRLVDDARVADALLDYLEEASCLGVAVRAEDIAQLPVALDRVYAGEQRSDAATNDEKASAEGELPAVQLVGARELALQKVPYVVLANLDAAHHPMAQASGAFDALLEKLGMGRADTRALQERCLLLDALASAQEGFAFYRVCHDREGSESCQSALWDELVTTYATDQDERDTVAQLPCALERADAVVRVVEAQVFGRDVSDDRVPVARGSLASQQLQHQLAQYSSGDAMPFSPTALEDYYRCPYRWFSSRRVGYNGMDNAFTASAQGNLAHGFFDMFYRELQKAGHARVTPQNLPEARQLASAVFDRYMERGLNKPRTGLFLRTEMDRLACDEVRDQVLAFIERDAWFLPEFAPTYFELELGRGTGSTLMYAGVPVRGKVDRIDVDSEGRAVIIDYKLSSLSAGYGLDKGAQLPGRIQTDIYAALVQRHFELLGESVRVVGSVYRSYSANMLRGVYAEGIDWGSVEAAKPKLDALPNADIHVGYDEYLDRVERKVEDCVERLVTGDIEPQPLSKGVCEYCRALAFCPRREA